MHTVSAPRPVPATQTTGLPYSMLPQSSAISPLSTQTFTPCPSMRSVCATSSTGYVPPNLRLMPRSAPLSAWAAVTIRTPRALSDRRISGDSAFFPGAAKPSTWPTITTGTEAPASAISVRSRSTVSPVFDAATMPYPRDTAASIAMCSAASVFSLPVFSKTTICKRLLVESAAPPARSSPHAGSVRL